MGDGIDKSSILKFIQSWKQMLNRGVIIYTIMPTKNKKEIPELLNRLKQLGVNIGFYDLQNLSFTVSERKIASIGIKSEKFEGGRIVVRMEHVDFAKNQANFFFSIWKKAIKY